MKNKVKIETIMAFKNDGNLKKECPSWLWGIIEKEVVRFYSNYSKRVNSMRDKIDETFDKLYPNYRYEDDNGEKVTKFYGDYYRACLIYKGVKSKNIFINKWFITDGLNLGFKTIFGTKYEIGFRVQYINTLYEI